jgi:hypothetical protein
MRIAHIILAHKNPAQIERLIKAMNHPNFDFYIHLDKKTDITPFEYLAKIKQVSFIERRIVCNWGGFTLVQSMLNSIDEIQETGVFYDFINLVSGQDYPIKPVREIYDFYNKNLGYSFMSFDESKATKWWQEAEARYKIYHFTDMPFKGAYVVQNIINKLLPKRKLPIDVSLYGSNKACWWTLSNDSAKYLSSYFKENPKLSKFLKFTWGSDEFILVTLLMNSPYKDRVINENYRYIDWSAGEAHPKVLKMKDYEQLAKSKMLFARKFDTATDDDELLSKLDNNILTITT